jgi:hypothetical protein
MCDHHQRLLTLQLAHIGFLDEQLEALNRRQRLSHARAP